MASRKRKAAQLPTSEPESEPLHQDASTSVSSALTSVPNSEDEQSGDSLFGGSDNDEPSGANIAALKPALAPVPAPAQPASQPAPNSVQPSGNKTWKIKPRIQLLDGEVSHQFKKKKKPSPEPKVVKPEPSTRSAPLDRMQASSSQPRRPTAFTGAGIMSYGSGARPPPVAVAQSAAGVPVASVQPTRPFAPVAPIPTRMPASRSEDSRTASSGPNHSSHVSDLSPAVERQLTSMLADFGSPEESADASRDRDTTRLSSSSRGGASTSAPSNGAVPSSSKPTDPRRRPQIAIPPATTGSPASVPASADSTSTIQPSASLQPTQTVPLNGSSTGPPGVPVRKTKAADHSAYLLPEFTSLWLDQLQVLRMRRVAIVQANAGDDQQQADKNKKVTSAIRKELRARGCTPVAIDPLDTPADKVVHPDIVIGPAAYMLRVGRQLPWIVDMRAAGTRFCLYDDASDVDKRRMIELGRQDGLIVMFSPGLMANEEDLLEILKTDLLEDLARLSKAWSFRILPEVVTHLASQTTPSSKRTPRQATIRYFLRQILFPPNILSLPDCTPPPIDTLAPDLNPVLLKQHQNQFSLELQLESVLCKTAEDVFEICSSLYPSPDPANFGEATIQDLIRKQEDLELAKDYRRFVIVSNEVPPEGIDIAGIEFWTVEELREEIRRALEVGSK